MSSYVQVGVNIPTISGVFDYHLPSGLEGKVRPGCLVAVPFGHQTVQGVVLEMIEIPRVMETRPVLALLDNEPVMTAVQLQLAREMAAETLSPLASCLDIMLPPGLSQQADTLFSLGTKLPAAESSLPILQARMLELLRQRGDLRGRQLESAFSRQNWKATARDLLKKGLIVSRPVLPPPSIHPKVVRMVQLACSPSEIECQKNDLGRGDTGIRRLHILEYLLKEPWPVLVSWVYANSGGIPADLEKLAEMGLVTLSEEEVWRDPLEQVEGAIYPAPVLTKDQQAVWEQVQPAIQKASQGIETPPFLLHGVTGSGKTEIYLQAAAQTLAVGRQVILMVPEIALTAQTVRRVLSRFPGQVGLMHSRLSPGERYDTWRRLRAGQLPVVIGPRSALFSPLPDVGLIVLDEFHDDSYYQWEGLPYYHAVTAAMIYGRLNHAAVILGSATPPVSLLYRANSAGWPVLSLPNRILAHRQAVESEMTRLGQSLPPLETSGETAVLPLPPVQVVDMRQELKAGNRSMFSRALQNALRQVLDSDQQAILFLNRRGKATYVFCRECGTVLRCPRCDLPLTLHTELLGKSAELLICHTCNYTRHMPYLCPQCRSPHIRQYGAGTEKVEKEVQVLFPATRTLRWDAETARQKGAHDLILSHFVNHRADVLIGTQMLAKGLDLPLVTLVGVVLADVGLNFPDFRAGERTFQLLTQVAGRAGRSPLGGQVILQTFQPDAYPIQAAAGHDYAAFYARELDERRKIGYPPFTRLVRMEARSQHLEAAMEGAKNLALQLQRWIDEEGCQESASLVGPVPCFFNRVNGTYRWQVILRAPDPLAILNRHTLPSESGRISYRVEIDPPDLL